MSSHSDIGNVDLQASHKIAHSLSAKKAVHHATPDHVPLLANISFPLDAGTETKQWTWGEWFIPPLGSGRSEGAQNHLP